MTLSPTEQFTSSVYVVLPKCPVVRTELTDYEQVTSAVRLATPPKIVPPYGLESKLLEGGYLGDYIGEYYRAY